MRMYLRSWPLVLSLLGALLVATATARASTIIDFSEPGEGPFDPNYFAARGVVFQDDLVWVGVVLGEEALVSTGWGGLGPVFHAVSGRVDPEITRISASVSLDSQYVSILQLLTFDQNSDLLTQTVLELNQIYGDSGFMGLRYFTVDSGPIPIPASSFLILNRSIRSTTNAGSGFVVRDITMTPVPEPSGVGLLGIGLVMVRAVRRLRT